jgi:Mg2+ and Co2+ transporter CorA
MSNAANFSFTELSAGLADALDCIRVVDRLIDKLVKSLNRRKLESVADFIQELENRSDALRDSQGVIRYQVRALEVRIEELQQDKDLKAVDVLTLGLGFFVRRGVIGIQEFHLKRVQASCRRKIEKLRDKGVSIQSRITKLEDALERMKQQENPSLLARILRWLQFIKNAISSIIGLVTGRIIKTLCSLHGVYDSVDSLRRQPSDKPHAAEWSHSFQAVNDDSDEEPHCGYLRL